MTWTDEDCFERGHYDPEGGTTITYREGNNFFYDYPTNIDERMLQDGLVKKVILKKPNKKQDKK